jgi:nucleoside-diphosphate-sugar epimerase
MIDPGIPLGFGRLPGATADLIGDPGRLLRATGWRPEVGLDEGLRRTVEWYRRKRGCLIPN